MLGKVSCFVIILNALGLALEIAVQVLDSQNNPTARQHQLVFDVGSVYRLHQELCYLDVDVDTLQLQEPR